MSPEPKENKLLPVKFTTEKDSAFRICHVDGAWGMVSNSKNIQLNFFVEHPSLPSTVIYRPNDEGTMRIETTDDIAPEADKENLCVTRTYQSAIVMSLETAKSIHAVLGNFISIAERLTNETGPV